MAKARTDFWNDAGKAGLILGGVSILYFTLNQLLSVAVSNGVNAMAMSLLNIVLWAAKLYLCIHLMKLALKSFAAKEQPGRSRLFRFGMTIALLSAFLVAAANYIYLQYINPELIATSMNEIATAYQNMLPAEQIDDIMEMVPSMPTYVFFYNLIYCWLFGTVLSAIMSSSICGREDPFANIK